MGSDSYNPATQQADTRRHVGMRAFRMTVDWMHVWAKAFAACLASAVKFVEALTVVQAVGATRGWRSALIESVLPRAGASR